MRTNGHGKPIVAVDIDGTLGDFHGNFLKFAALYFGRDDFPLPVETNPGLPLWEWMGIEQRDYREAKLAYRQGGWKRWMPVYNWAAELTWSIQDAGAEVWICTTRPYLRLDNVDPDTREWLWRNEIHYDAVIFDRVDEKGSKYAELARQAEDRVCSVIDDLPEMIEQVESAGLRFSTMMLRDQPYNRHLNWQRRVTSLDSAWRRFISKDIIRWKEQNGI